jgi:hypothetical protein
MAAERHALVEGDTSMKLSGRIWIWASVLVLFAGVMARGAVAQSQDDSDAHPPASKSDIEIIKRARQILDSPEKWNRADNRVCPDSEKTFSLYCALEKATDEVTADFAHRGAAMQDARFVIDEVLAPNNHYEHRLMNYNNDPKTTFADVQKFFDLLQARIEKELKEQETNPPPAAVAKPPVAQTLQTQIEIVKKAEEILNSPAKWDRASTQDCKPEAKTFGLFCLFAAASVAVTGKNDEEGAAITAARKLISNAPNAAKYQARLVDYNNDPTVTFEDVQKLLKTVQTDLEKKLAAQTN